jgi:hypothetical protein
MGSVEIGSDVQIKGCERVLISEGIGDAIETSVDGTHDPLPTELMDVD